MAPSLESLSTTESKLRSEFQEQLRGIPDGEKISQCIQCGTCTGSCPVSYAMDITPRQAVALYRSGHLEELLRSRTIWMCASCYSCTVRCPSGIKITDTMYALKRVAMSNGIYPKKHPVHVLSRAFIDNLQTYGRNFELGLGIRYLMRANFFKLFSTMGYGLTMIRKGRLALIPKKIRRVNEVRAIIEKANQLEA